MFSTYLVFGPFALFQTPRLILFQTNVGFFGIHSSRGAFLDDSVRISGCRSLAHHKCVW